MQIIHDFITPNEYSRPCKALREVLGLVLHWTAAPEQNAQQVRAYFESKKTGSSGYGSAHYIVDQNGIIVAAIPENEIAYHCGSSQPDPKSGRIYTDRARAIFGRYAQENNSPNNCTLSIELCPIDAAGHMSAATLEAAAELAGDICKRHAITIDRIVTHKDVVGWKDCPKGWNNSTLTLFHANALDYKTR